MSVSKTVNLDYDYLGFSTTLDMFIGHGKTFEDFGITEKIYHDCELPIENYTEQDHIKSRLCYIYAYYTFYCEGHKDRHTVQQFLNFVYEKAGRFGSENRTPPPKQGNILEYLLKFSIKDLQAVGI